MRRLSASEPVVYMIFDLLWLDGHSLMALTYDERRAQLAELELAGPTWQAPAHHVGNGAALLEASKAQGLEGLVAKRRDCPYIPGRRSQGWVKVKNVRNTDVVVGGWVGGDGGRARQDRRARDRLHHRGGRAALRRQGRHRLQRGRAQAPAGHRRPARPRHVARSPAPSPRRRRTSSSRRWSPASTTATSPTPERCATRSTRACATTSTRPTPSRRKNRKLRAPSTGFVRMEGWRDQCGVERSPSGS